MTGLVIRQTGRVALLTLALLTLAACGGGSGKGGNKGGQTSVTISGTVSYEFPPPNGSCNGLNFGAIVIRPIRGATVQLLNAGSGAQIASTISSATGAYSFSNVAASTTVQLRVRAELKAAGVPGWDVEVRDNFIAGASDFDLIPPPALGTRALYTLDSSNFSSGSANVSRNLTAATGWSGAAYTGTRAAAPFALLDVFYRAMQFVRATDATAHFPPLDAFWSVNNKFQTDGTDLTAGELPTSAFFPSINSLFILGDDTDDPDEFDEGIAAHEWSHYFEANFSRSDSFGGPHGLGESLLAPLAFGEGWASALGAMVRGDPAYCDTRVPLATTGGGFSAEGNSFGVKGWFNEMSVIALIYDLADTGIDGVDDRSIGFGPIYDVMTGPQVVTEGLTTLFSFATELRASLGATDAAFLNDLLDRENVFSGATLDIWASDETNDGGGLAQDVLPLYVDFIADGSVQNICVDSALDGLDRDGNNIGEDRFLRITIPFDDEYDVSLVTTTPTPVTPDPDDRDQSDPDIYIIRGAGPEFIASGTAPDENVEPTFRTPMMLASETYVAIVEEWRFDDWDAASLTYPQRICFDVSMTPTP